MTFAGGSSPAELLDPGLALAVELPLLKISVEVPTLDPLKDRNCYRT